MYEKLSNSRQLGGIEVSVLSNGAAAGSRIAWVNTGSKLRFKLVLDRAMDVFDAFYGENCLAWLSGVGITPPARRNGFDWLSGFGGGLLVTCGLSHFGPPETNEFGAHCLHGGISNVPMEIETVKQPDPYAGDMEMYIVGNATEVTVFGPRLRLRRKISCTIGKPEFRIHDEVTNLANERVPHMILYHSNFGWPLVDDCARLEWNGDWTPSNPSDSIMKIGEDIKACRAPTKLHSGAKESVAFIDPSPDSDGKCRCGVSNPKIGIRTQIEFDKTQLPCLVNWQHWGEREYVAALEPGTNPPQGQNVAKKAGKLIFLEPMETRSYDLVYSVTEL